ncbi:DUF4226 domain-containing protein [Mycolicibacterium novocastrense]|uniref:Biofilm regulator BssS n=1 Tax=Mycolicibacterium novocastrense TaxID=59813 RepID=A0AAW5SHM2_MYCNV|nr:DUF4226 domain-containing protein [Mycolicibacterium novocastrense]MCV7023650.1 DUF4226 domain-containing protein [Mycolicibacterium novocastrense]GAT07706.1 biofilm regulator BssS [Mycolicibacterium novocastrense]
MGSYDDLRHIIKHIAEETGDPNAWQQGLTPQQIRDVNGWLNSDGAGFRGYRDPETGVVYEDRSHQNSSVNPAVPDDALDRIRNMHPELFNPETKAAVMPAPPPAAPAPPPAAPAPPGPSGGDADAQQGEGAEAIKKLEDSLKGQNSKVAEADRTLAAAVLNAFSNTVEGKQKLAVLQQSIEDAVNRQTALDTPMGAREFQKFLLSKQKEIIDVVAEADLDDKSKREILAGLYALNAAPHPEKADESDPNAKNAGEQADGAGNGGGDNAGAGAGAGTTPPAGSNVGATGDPLADLLGDPLLSDPGLLGGDPLGGMGSQLPQMPMPTMPSMPGLGGGGLPGLFGGGGAPAASGLSDLLKPKDNTDEPDPVASLLDDPLLGAPPEGSEGSEQPQSPLDPDKPEGEKAEDDKPNNEQPTSGAPVPGPLAPPVPPGTGPTEVHLPNGQTVTAPNPQLANVTKAISEGTPIADAFRQNGMTIAPPGAAVPNPMDPSRLTMGAVGQFTDHQVYAINKDLAFIDGQIRPISDVNGRPGFLGWMPPPELPAAPLAPPTTSTPADPAAPTSTPTANNNTGTGTTLLTPTGQR